MLTEVLLRIHMTIFLNFSSVAESGVIKIAAAHEVDLAKSIRNEDEKKEFQRVELLVVKLHILISRLRQISAPTTRKKECQQVVTTAREILAFTAAPASTDPRSTNAV